MSIWSTPPVMMFAYLVLGLSVASQLAVGQFVSIPPQTNALTGQAYANGRSSLPVNQAYLQHVKQQEELLSGLQAETSTNAAEPPQAAYFTTTAGATGPSNLAILSCEIHVPGTSTLANEVLSELLKQKLVYYGDTAKTVAHRRSADGAAVSYMVLPVVTDEGKVVELISAYRKIIQASAYGVVNDAMAKGILCSVMDIVDEELYREIFGKLSGRSEGVHVLGTHTESDLVNRNLTGLAAARRRLTHHHGTAGYGTAGYGTAGYGSVALGSPLLRLANIGSTGLTYGQLPSIKGHQNQLYSNGYYRGGVIPYGVSSPVMTLLNSGFTVPTLSSSSLDILNAEFAAPRFPLVSTGLNVVSPGFSMPSCSLSGGCASQPIVSIVDPGFSIPSCSMSGGCASQPNVNIVDPAFSMPSCSMSGGCASQPNFNIVDPAFSIPSCSISGGCASQPNVNIVDPGFSMPSCSMSGGCASQPNVNIVDPGFSMPSFTSGSLSTASSGFFGYSAAQGADAAAEVLKAMQSTGSDSIEKVDFSAATFADAETLEVSATFGNGVALELPPKMGDTPINWEVKGNHDGVLPVEGTSNVFVIKPSIPAARLVLEFTAQNASAVEVGRKIVQITFE